MNTNQKTIGEIVADDFRAAVIFESFGIDFCCKGNRTIEAACDKKNVNPEEVNEALGKLKNESKGNMPDFSSWPIDLLADYIEKKHHRYISETTPVLLQFLEKLCRVHGQGHPELFEITGHFDESSSELAVHMKKEELILFPYARRLMKMDAGMGAMKLNSASEPISVMMHEHEQEGERFRKIAELSNNYTPPADGCTTYRVAFQMLKEFQDDLHMHIHLENNILFPQILQMDKAKKNEQANQASCSTTNTEQGTSSCSVTMLEDK